MHMRLSTISDSVRDNFNKMPLIFCWLLLVIHRKGSQQHHMLAYGFALVFLVLRKPVLRSQFDLKPINC